MGRARHLMLITQAVAAAQHCSLVIHMGRHMGRASGKRQEDASAQPCSGLMEPRTFHGLVMDCREERHASCICAV
jgi:hypothetical protein